MYLWQELTPLSDKLLVHKAIESSLGAHSNTGESGVVFLIPCYNYAQVYQHESHELSNYLYHVTFLNDQH